MADILQDIARRNRAGEAAGIWAACTAHPSVLDACLAEAAADGSPLLVEATCNQVNQEGGYTGRTPATFRDELLALAAGRGFPAGRLVLGGDHLGPSPWQSEPAELALGKAAAMVEAYVKAGFSKIHLDASMPCADDPKPLPPDLIADRAAALCAVAERVPVPVAPVYVIGTEVPTPGGAQEALDHVTPTRVEDLDATIELHRTAFARRGLGSAWERVLAVVVRPGVEFGQDSVAEFRPEAARGLAEAIGTAPGLVFEAHSTDYQRPDSLRALVQAHFAVLKVGPGLTFAYREALFALEAIEAELLPVGERSGLRRTLDEAMLRQPEHWRRHHHGTAAEQAFARAWSLSDRSRYYWPLPEVTAVVDRLLANLSHRPLPATLLSQFLPVQHAAVRGGRLEPEPRALIGHKVREVARAYAFACGMATSPQAP
jgi:D-tagatose-1,6-bisphosphate aldolase subunit GatZ/KbaZ